MARKWFELYEESLQEQPGNSRNNNNNNRRSAPYVQASVGEFQVTSNNNNNNNSSNGNGDQARAENFIGQNIVQPQAAAAPMPVIQQCAPAFNLAPAPPTYPYGFYPPFTGPPPIALHPQVHPAYMPVSSPGGPPNFPYNAYYPAVTTSAGTVVGMPPHLRGVIASSGGHLYPGQPLISNVVSPAAISQAQRFQMLTGQPIPLHGAHHLMHAHVHPRALHPHHPQQPLQQLSQRQLTHLLSAYRVGMLALESLARRVVDDRPQVKYARNPSYGEDVKWLLNCAKKLGTSYLQDFCICAVNSVASPFVLYEIILDAAQYLSQTSSQPLAQSLRSPLIAPLLQKCQQMYDLACLPLTVINLPFALIRRFISCTHFKMYHIIPADYEDFVQVVRSARAAFQLTGQSKCISR